MSDPNIPTPESAPKPELPYVLKEVFFERVAQIQKGYTDEVDDRYNRGELALCAMAYACHGGNVNAKQHKNAQFHWPLSSAFNPKDNRTNLIRAAAMLLAEVERLDRAAPPISGN